MIGLMQRNPSSGSNPPKNVESKASDGDREIRGSSFELKRSTAEFGKILFRGNRVFQSSVTFFSNCCVDD